MSVSEALLDSHPNYQSIDLGFRLLRRLRGASQALLVEDTEARRWVLKLYDNPSGSNVLASDLLGTRLMAHLGLPSIPCTEVTVGESFFEDKETWFQEGRGTRRPEAGVHFASRFLPDLVSGEVFDFIPRRSEKRISNREDFLGAFVFDLWAGHCDYRQALYRQREPNGTLEAVLVDNGHLFGGPGWDINNVPVFPYVSQQQRRLFRRFTFEDVDRWIEVLQSDLPEAVERIVCFVPPRWYNGDIDNLRNELLKRIESLPATVHQSIESAGGAISLFPGMCEYDEAKDGRSVPCHRGGL